MSEVPVQVIVAAYQDEQAAKRTLDELQKAQKDGLIKIRDAAVLTKDPDGKLHIKDTRDWGFGKGALAGGVVGIILGILAGPVGWGLVGGALIGGVAAKMADGGFDDKRLQQLGASLKPGSSAIVAVIDHVWVAQAQAIMQKEAQDATTQAISADIAKQLDEGRDVVYTAVGMGDAVAAERIAAGKDSAQISEMVATPDAVYAEGANITKDSVTAGAMLATKEGVTAVVAEGKPEAEAAAKEITAGASDAASSAASATSAAADAAKDAAAGAADATAKSA